MAQSASCFCQVKHMAPVQEALTPCKDAVRCDMEPWFRRGGRGSCPTWCVGHDLRPSAVWSESDAQKRRESVWASLPTLQQVVLVLIGARKVGSGESSFTRCQNINNNCSL